MFVLLLFVCVKFQHTLLFVPAMCTLLRTTVPLSLLLFLSFPCTSTGFSSIYKAATAAKRIKKTMPPPTDDYRKDSVLLVPETSCNDAASVGTATSIPSVIPKSLPDVDDQSMTQVFDYIDSYQTDLSWSFLSDSFFIVGGIGYIVTATWDCLRMDSHHWAYHTAEVGAPTVYLFNSVVDMMWAYSIQQRHKVKRRMEDTWRDWRVLLDYELAPPVIAPSSETEPQAAVTAAMSFSSGTSWIARARKHAAHRRTMLAAFTFGVAAIFAVASVFVSYFDGKDHATPTSLWWEGALDAVSVHVYLLSAIVAVSGKRTRPWLSRMSLRNPETLEDLGDLLFLIGSAVDAALCDMSFDDDQPGWPLLSSILWFLDACFYLRADFVMAHRMIVPEEERSSELV
jgi:hypothetical protein